MRRSAKVEVGRVMPGKPGQQTLKTTNASMKAARKSVWRVGAVACWTRGKATRITGDRSADSPDWTDPRLKAWLIETDGWPEPASE
jgi:hypothetical protein